MVRVALQSLTKLVALASLAGSAYAASLAGSAHAMSSSLILTEADARRTVEINVNAAIEIRLKAQLGTGYSWSLETPPKAGFHTVDAPTISNETIPGGWQYQIFAFVGSEPGRYPITFAYRQPWTDSKAEERRISFHIVVRPSL